MSMARSFSVPTISGSSNDLPSSSSRAVPSSFVPSQTGAAGTVSAFGAGELMDGGSNRGDGRGPPRSGGAERAGSLSRREGVGNQWRPAPGE